MRSKASIRILVADDDPGILETYQNILSPPQKKDKNLSSEINSLAGSLFGTRSKALKSTDSEIPTPSYELVMCQKDNGQVDISGKLDKANDGSKVVHISIKDNGRGIPLGDLERIFEKGFSKKERDTGVGLHWSANAISDRNGKIYAESKGLEQGACFHMLIPVQS